MFAFWSGLDTRRKAIAVLASVAMFAAVLGLSRIAGMPGMALLYAGLDGTQAGEVIAALDQEGVAYEVRGTSVYVDGSRRDELRMVLAGQGLPRNGGAGYELLDGLSGFGTTSQMFDAAYWRAKEGELARTIVANPNIRTARVHIANPSPSPFQRDVTPSASVTVSTAGAPVSPDLASALRFLVASAVAGLAVDQVAIIDASSGRVIEMADDPALPGDADERTARLKSRLERLLEARVGTGGVIVEVSIETETDTESIVERRIDPESRVAVSTDTEENESSAANDGGGAVTVASNLPSGDGAATEGGGQSQSTALRERTNYDFSETTRQISRGPGAIRRLSIAVLVDGLEGEAGWEPRSDAELADLRDLVASAAGVDESRGDVITIRSLQFEGAEALGTEATAGLLSRLPLDPMRLVQLGVLAAVALVLGLFVVRPILSGGARAPAEAGPGAAAALAGPDPEAEPGAALADAARMASDQALQDLPPPAPERAAPMREQSGRAAAAPSLDEDPVGHLKTLIEGRQPDTIEILRSWLEDAPAREEA